MIFQMLFFSSYKNDLSPNMNYFAQHENKETLEDLEENIVSD